MAATSDNFVIRGRDLDVGDLLDGLDPLSFPAVDGGGNGLDGIGTGDKLYMTLSGMVSLQHGRGGEGRGVGREWEGCWETRGGEGMGGVLGGVLGGEGRGGEGCEEGMRGVLGEEGREEEGKGVLDRGVYHSSFHMWFHFIVRRYISYWSADQSARSTKSVCASNGEEWQRCTGAFHCR